MGHLGHLKEEYHELLGRLEAGAKPGVRVLYISPLKALVYDIERNLRAPLTGIHIAAEQLGLPPPRVTTAMRTGDTPAGERTAMLRKPPDILITTPESLCLLLANPAAAELFAHLDGVVLDYLPTAADQQARVKPVYETVEGWSESTEGARSWAELPANAIKYVRRVE